MQDHSIEEIYVLQSDSYISNFNVYDNNCYFILSSAGDAQWKCYDLVVGNDIENLEDVHTVSEVAAPTGEEVLAMREHVLEGMSEEEIERLTENIKTANLSMEHANNIYKLLHDMDYYLLRYGLGEVAPYTQDNSTLAKYYGVLTVYD